jgi:menaquinone-specific isochorismate synthase
MTAYNALWSRAGLTLAGTGDFTKIDPGTGARRYQLALDALRDSGKDVAFASFTFDPGRSGSVVIIPERVSGEFDAAPSQPGGLIEEPDDSSWRDIVEMGLEAIHSGELSKVVLARHLDARLRDQADVFGVAASLLKTQPDCHIFAVDGLVGASPELLLRLDDGLLQSVPLAGSSVEDDGSLSTSKMAEEHSLAADSVADALVLSGIEFHRGSPEVLDVGSIQHLATRFTGSVRPDATFADLLPRLHPTAAVAGTPRAAAMALIRRLEGDTRGRYSGPVGWFDTDGDCEFALALRCGFVEGNRVRLHSGAGIVADSEPGAELAETWWKLQPMAEALDLPFQIGQDRPR